jgi:hypothetical protein
MQGVAHRGTGGGGTLGAGAEGARVLLCCAHEHSNPGVSYASIQSALCLSAFRKRMRQWPDSTPKGCGSPRGPPRGNSTGGRTCSDLPPTINLMLKASTPPARSTWRSGGG